MKKIIAIVMMCLAFTLMASATTTYYVEITGSDTNDGLSEANAFATVSAAFDSIQTSFSADNSALDYVINVGAGTFTESNLAINNSKKAMTITINGEGANSTIFQGAAAIDATTRRLFKLPIANNEQLSITVNDLKAKNYGGTGDDATNTIISLTKIGMKFYANHCVFSDIDARATAILPCTHLVNAELIDCSFIDINCGTGTLFYVNRSRSTVLKNCVFNNCSRDLSAWSTLTDDNYTGTILHCEPKNNWRTCEVSIINNTVTNSSIDNADAITRNDIQSLFFFANPLENNKTTGGKINLTFANNIICGTTYPDYTSAEYLDINIIPTKIDAGNNSINFTDCSNNILNSADADFPSANNTISSTLTYTSPELDFLMDGAEIDQDTTSTGLIYVTAKGTAVVDKGLASVQPENGINGVLRTTTGGDIGAVEYLAAGDQYIIFDNISNARLSQVATITLAATASSSLPVTFECSDNSVATISGNTLTPITVGKVTITAIQAGDATYNAADNVSYDIYFAEDDVDLYISTSGNDDNDGMSEASPLATIGAAISLTQELFDEAACDTFTYYIGEGTFDAHSIVLTNNSAELSVCFIGEGADKTIITADQTLSTTPGVKFFQTLKSAHSNMHLSFSQLNISNYGYTTGSSGAVFFIDDAAAANISIKVDACNIDNITSRYGAVYFGKGQTTSFSLTNSYLAHVESHNTSNAFSSAIHLQAGELNVENCVFDSFVRNHKTATSQVNNLFGNVINIQNLATNNTVGIKANIINNTFINDSVINATTLRKDQSVIYILNSHATVLPEVSIANNLFVGGMQSFIGKNADASADETRKVYDIYFNSAGQPVNFIDTTNNVLNTLYEIGGTGNDTSAAYTYTSSEVDFVMDGDYPELFSSDNGVLYVKAMGTSVADAALLSLAPEYDIAGNIRSTTTPWIGAYEEEETTPTAIEENHETAVSLYPNPTSNMLYISGDVAKLELYSIAGRMVQASTLNAGSIDISQLNNGVYFVKCQNEVGATIATKRIIKQ